MLKKLLKYDFENIYKVLVIFYILAIFFAILTRIFLNIENSFIFNIIGKILSGVTISMIFNIIINNVMGLWGRFKRNFYGDESYLTHTLPIDKQTHYLSKILTTIITLFTSIIIIGLTLFIAYYSKELMNTIKELLLPLATIYNSKVTLLLLGILFILFLEFLNLTQCGFTGLILGHKRNDNKLLYSIILGFVSFMVSQTIMVASLFIIGLFNKDIMNLIFTNEMINIESTKKILILSMIMYSAISLIGYFINNKLFNQGVNVD